MKNLFFYLSLITLSLALCLTTACKSDDDNGGGGVNCVNYQSDQAFVDATNAYSTALSTWLQNQTPENCDALIASLKNLVTQYRRFDSCVSTFSPQERQQYEDNLNEFEANINTFEANGCM